MKAKLKKIENIKNKEKTKKKKKKKRGNNTTRFSVRQSVPSWEN